MSNRVKIRPRRRRKSLGGNPRAARNDTKRAERAEAKRLGFPSRKRWLRDLKRHHKGEPKPAVVTVLKMGTEGHGKFKAVGGRKGGKSVFQPKTLQDYGVKALRSMAKEYGVSGFSKMKKDDLISAIKGAMNT